MNVDAPPFPSAAERHEASRRLYLARDLNGYMDHFTPDLVYRQADGNALNREQLTRQVADQFRRLSAADWISRVESEDRVSDRIEEVVRQTGTFVTSAFGLVHRLWKLERRARYTWKMHAGRWRICDVHVIEESLVGAGLKFGAKPRVSAEPPTSAGEASGTTP